MTRFQGDDNSDRWPMLVMTIIAVSAVLGGLYWGMS